VEGVSLLGIKRIIETTKQIHKEDIVFVKLGTFYYTYNWDAYIISYIFGYKTKLIEGMEACGFPLNSKSRVIAKLEDKKINYIILDRKNNYEVNEKYDNKNLNTYNKYLQKARIYINNKKRLDSIYKYMLENTEKKDFKYLINKMEEIINERRKI
jgi:hypothetical protein